MDGDFGTSGFLLELSCSRFKCVIMLENVLRGECSGEVSLTGNEGARRGREKGDIFGVCIL